MSKVEERIAQSGTITIDSGEPLENGPLVTASPIQAFKKGIVDVSVMEKLIEQALAAQLLSVHRKATGKDCIETQKTWWLSE